MKYLKGYKLYEEGTAMATAGNTGGMGAITAPTVSATPGDVSGSIAGSGDIAAHGVSYEMDPKTKKTKKKKTKRTKRGIGESTNARETMYVTRFDDWDYPKENKVYD